MGIEPGVHAHMTEDQVNQNEKGGKETLPGRKSSLRMCLSHEKSNDIGVRASIPSQVTDYLNLDLNQNQKHPQKQLAEESPEESVAEERESEK